VRPSYVYRATCERVIDGDTYDLRADLGFNVFARIRTRLHGANCPELSTEEGRGVRDYVDVLLTGNPSLVMESYKDARSFERWVCDVWLPNGILLSEHLIEKGMATRI
jgi:endonuclease YncB( thermonuclease family)